MSEIKTFPGKWKLRGLGPAGLQNKNAREILQTVGGMILDGNTNLQITTNKQTKECQERQKSGGIQYYFYYFIISLKGN